MMYNIHSKPSLSYNNLKSTPNSHSRLGNLELLRTLKKTASSKIKLGKDVVTKQEYAVKLLKPSKVPQDTSNFDQEAQVHLALSQQDHPNIIKLVKYLSDVDYIKKNGNVVKTHAIIMELATEGDLYDHFKILGPVSEETARTYFEHLISAIECIHNAGFAHMDLRLENLLLTEDLSLKIADFSYTAAFSSKTLSETRANFNKITNYSAPELIYNQCANVQQAEVFSCGVILFTMVMGYPPFNQAQDNYYRLIKNRQFTAFWKQHERNGRVCSKEFKDLINGMLAEDVSERLTLSEVKAHPWFLGTRTPLLAIQAEFAKNKQTKIDQLEARAITEKNSKKAKQASLQSEKTVTKKPCYAMTGIKIKR